MKEILIDGNSLSVEQVVTVALAKQGEVKVQLTEDSKKKIARAKEYVHEIVNKDNAVYGINTGFGALSNVHIDKSDLGQLQVNLIRSHCTGVGEAFNREVTRAIMLLRANCLASGYSGVNPEAIDLLIDFLNHDIIPFVPSKGSVGASGDLAPLSHIALCLIGEGQVTYSGKSVRSDFAISQISKKPITLGPKDGLALINGTAVMAALGSLAIVHAEKIMTLADISAAMTCDGVKGSKRAYDPRIQKLKPHPGQIAVAQNLNSLLEGSEIMDSHDTCGKVQDPYSLRCVPQVHGACRQTLEHIKVVFDRELNAVTDNPLLFIEDDDVISGGNFHGEALALAMDYLAMGVAEICNISERRVEKMMNPTFSELPAFLTGKSGLNSGLMIAHVTSAALVSENKYLCHPASVDSVPTSTDKEDHVSMGVTSGRKLLEVVENAYDCLSIEILCNTQAIEFQKPLKTSKPIQAAYDVVRRHVEPITEDRVFHNDMMAIKKLLKTDEILNEVKKHMGELQ
ncbi:MAG: histidine ammonia-lyase [Halobacteriovoraceae bacterium]|nr:histidine ammonia-lyase [Halobacteriovoraceae bacterium]